MLSLESGQPASRLDRRFLCQELNVQPVGDAADLYILADLFSYSITTCFFASLTFCSLHAGLFSTRSFPTLWRAAAGRRAARNARRHSRLAPSLAPFSGPRHPRRRHSHQRRLRSHRVLRLLLPPTRLPRAKPRAPPLTPPIRWRQGPPRVLSLAAALSSQSSARIYCIWSLVSHWDLLAV